MHIISKMRQYRQSWETGSVLCDDFFIEQSPSKLDPRFPVDVSFTVRL